MQISVTRQAEDKVELEFKAGEQDVAEAVSKAYADIAGQARIPGFRAGKAPRSVIDTRVGRERVLAEAREALISGSYEKALDEHDLRPVGRPDVGEVPELDEGAEFAFTVTVQVRPQWTVGSIEGLEITMRPSVASDADVDAEIERIRERFATLEPVERAVETGDFVLISFTSTIGGEKYAGGEVDKFLYESGKNLMPEEFEKALVGSKAGDHVQARFDIPDTSSNEEFVGKPAVFEIDIHEVKEKNLPALDKAFAESVGGFESMDELRSELKDNMTKSRERQREQEIEIKARAVLAERVTGPVPEPMVDQRFSQMMRDFEAGLQQRETNMQQYLESTGISFARLNNEVHDQAEVSLREELALEALFRHLGLEVTDADIEGELAELAGSEGDPSALRAKWEELGVIRAVRDQVVMRKASAWLAENVKVIETDEPEPAAAEKPSPKKRAAGKKTGKKDDADA